MALESVNGPGKEVVHIIVLGTPVFVPPNQILSGQSSLRSPCGDGNYFATEDENLKRANNCYRGRVKIKWK